MKVLVFGSKDWSDYGDIMRNMTIILEDFKYNEDERLNIVHAASKGAETMVTEYIGKVEKFLRQKGVSIKEEIFKPNPTADYDVISQGADLALVFSTGNDKRINYCSKMLAEFGIPTKVIKG